MVIDTFNQRLAASREKWVELGDARALLFRRPHYIEQCRLRDKNIGEESYMVDLISACCVDWRGFTAADLLPGDTQEALPFASDLLQVAMDNKEWRVKISNAFVEFWIETGRRREAAEKN